MKERPILFSTEMVKAILEGRKTQTRRVINPQPDSRGLRSSNVPFEDWHGREVKCPYGNVGDVLWVRESWNGVRAFDGSFSHYRYKADGDPLHNGMRWKPSIHMPKDAARIWLKITDIRVQRLHDITPMDAAEEGIEIYPANSVVQHWKDYMNIHKGMTTAVGSFVSLWCSINGTESWDSNPWVWVITFDKIDKPNGE
jgi:hypothetical protein